MHKYCKAYMLSNLRHFPQWSEKQEEGAEPLTDETIVYIWDDFTVVRSLVQSNGAIFDTVTPQWQRFCETILNFAIPENLQYAYKQPEATT